MQMKKACLALLLLNATDGLRKHQSGTPNDFSSCGMKGKNMSMQIVNGQEAAECDWRWQVAFVRSSLFNKRVFCGGMLLSPEWVLTAGHCAKAAGFDVVAGEHNTKSRSGKEQWRKAAKWVRHYKYNGNTFDFDYAMVKLDRPIEMGECAGTICLPTADVTPGQTCWITGWGSEKVGGGMNTMLQQAPVKTISTASCANDYDYDTCKVTSNMFCAQGATADGKTVDACTGDSGGPLVCEENGRWTLYGVTSWGAGCAKPTAPGVWSDVHEARDWIEEVMAGNEPELPPGACPPYCRRCPAELGCTSAACAGCCD